MSQDQPDTNLAPVDTVKLSDQAIAEVLRQVRERHAAEASIQATTSDGRSATVTGRVSAAVKGWVVTAYGKFKLGAGAPKPEAGLDITKKLGRQ